jgi:nitrilase
VIGTDIGRIALAICWENMMPLYRTALYQQHVQLWCALTVDSRDTWTASRRHIAAEGRCFVLSANQYATTADYPADWPTDHRADHPPDQPTEHPADPTAGSPDSGGPAVIRGGSCIIDPLGQLLAGPSFDRPDILLADLDTDTLDGAYLDLDVTGHYARPRSVQPHHHPSATPTPAHPPPDSLTQHRALPTTGQTGRVPDRGPAGPTAA